jgi:hypothetical protein
MKKRILLVCGVFIFLLIAYCKINLDNSDMVELKRIKAPRGGDLEVILYEHRGEGEIRLKVVKKGVKLYDSYQKYPNIAVKSDTLEPFVIEWLNQCDLLVKVIQGSVRTYVSWGENCKSNKNHLSRTGQIYLIHLPIKNLD